ncbi:MAG: 23S rRNA (pseudouridine(1915)-N(3))-methyltransferase RlmH [Bacteroidales bacterium]
MKIKLLWIGKEEGDVFNDAILQYIKKLSFYTPFETIIIPYLKNAKSISFEEQKKKEGELILKKLENTDFVVLLDERGKELTSVLFSQFIQQQINTGIKNMVFIIGGAYGFSKELYTRQNYQLSLSKLTFPHIMTRLIFVEQLYRAFTILKNEPYHHE